MVVSKGNDVGRVAVFAWTRFQGFARLAGTAKLMRPVLYADDDSDDVFFMQYVWEELAIANPLIGVAEGQAVIDYLAGNGVYADRAKHPLPCLLLLDLNMPGKNGFDVLRWIRHHPDFKALPVVIVSASNNAADREAAQELGITDYVVKPTSPGQLIEIVRAKKALWLGGKP